LRKAAEKSPGRMRRMHLALQRGGKKNDIHAGRIRVTQKVWAVCGGLLW